MTYTAKFLVLDHIIPALPLPLPLSLPLPLPLPLLPVPPLSALDVHPVCPIECAEYFPPLLNVLLRV